MKKLYEKNELTFAIVWIVAYCVLQSLANPLNKAIGVAYAASAAFCVLQSVVLFTFIRRSNLQKQYGLCKPHVPASRLPAGHDLLSRRQPASLHPRPCCYQHAQCCYQHAQYLCE